MFPITEKTFANRYIYFWLFDRCIEICAIIVVDRPCSHKRGDLSWLSSVSWRPKTIF
jgi:hypothetical protein